MAEKSYLKNQVRLVSLKADDLYTDEEYDLYMNQLCPLINQEKALKKNDTSESKAQCQQLKKQRKALGSKLGKTIKKQAKTPRVVRLESVLYRKKGEPMLPGVNWRCLKESKKISSFSSDLTRALGLKNQDVTFDLVVIKWKKEDMLEQLVMNGFYFDLLQPDGSVIRKKYRCFTASASQLRTDRVCFISEDAWAKVKGRIECGMSWDVLNAHGGINVNKLLPYLALCTSATDPWPDFDIDRCIVVPDWKAEVTGDMLYIKSDYTTERGVRTVEINHVDGAGMMLPSVSKTNFMIRSQYIKGLLAVFDFMKFCKERGVKPVIKDFWGLEHDLVKENIQIILTDSQFKLAKYYDSWDHYKTEFKQNHCEFCKTNYEEDYVPDKDINYQMLQTLVDFTDEEIDAFTAKTHEKILGIGTNKQRMLETLKASPTARNPLQRALYLYPDLLRDGYTKQQLKDIKKKMLNNAKSGAIRCDNKRLYVIPDFYAACGHWFCHEERPRGLLKNGEIACRAYRGRKVDVLRSPHLYMEHNIRYVVDDPEVYKWFTTDAVVTSKDDLISRVCQFDVDGDMLNIVGEKTIVDAAERNIREHDIVPLFYDANKAAPELISNHALYHGLYRAHKFSNIGEISNMLTALWNKDDPDYLAAALLCYLNNLRIDGAKNGYVDEYTNYPQIKRMINKATGGKHGAHPYFFKFSKNQRNRQEKEKENRKMNGQIQQDKEDDDDKFDDWNKSTMNRICRRFENIGKIRFDTAGIAPFNYNMLLSEPCTEDRPECMDYFIVLEKMITSIDAQIAESSPSEIEQRNKTGMYRMVADDIAFELVDEFGSLEACYPYIVKKLFDDKGIGKSSHKRMFWLVFGEIALKNLEYNLANCRDCSDCNAKIPLWEKDHKCVKDTQGFAVCKDCGKTFLRKGTKSKRCDECQKEYDKLVKRASAQRQREMKSKVKKKRFTSSRSRSKRTS